MTLSAILAKAAAAIYAADAAILSALVDQRVISATTATDVGGVIAALAIGWGGHVTYQAAQAKSAPAHAE